VSADVRRASDGLEIAEPTFTGKRAPLSKPDFILIGQQRAGTRWLHDQLRTGNRFWLPPIKEISYFKGNVFRKGEFRELLEKAERGDLADFSDADIACIRHLRKIAKTQTMTSADYLHIFSFKGERISGDITPNYETIPPEHISGIRELIPDVKVIYLLRHPVDRIESAIGMSINYNRVSPDCLSSLEAMAELLTRKAFVLRMSPTETWKNWSSIFPERNMGYWFFDDIRDRPGSVRNSIATFLEADGCTFGLPAGFNRKEVEKKWRLEPEVRDYIRSHVDRNINETKAFFGSRSAEWQ
jgi:hypothetical protein